MLEFLRAAGVRALRTFLQTLAVALLAVGALDELDVQTVALAALYAALVSVVMSLVSLPEIGRGLGGAAGLAVSALWRAVRTFAQTAGGVLGAGLTFSDIDWRSLWLVAGLAALTSLVQAVLEGLPEAPAAPSVTRA